MQRFAAPDSTEAESSLVSDTQYYLNLTPRQLPSRYFYDALGSALFEAICQLPWYRITRAEQRLLSSHGREILSRLEPLTTLVELGPGSGEKLASLIGSGRKRRSPLTVHLVDVSAAALDLAHRTLNELDAVDVVLHEATYETGLREVAGGHRNDGRLLTLFLGSNIGNFDRPGANAFLRSIRAALAPGDALLIGVDLVKPEAELLLAYDDPLGVTAAFNRNLLVRINRELDADFDLDAFQHRAVWNAEASRVEMHLVTVGRQRVRIRRAALDITFEDGEIIWTESSYKYRPSGIIYSLEATGFRRLEQWTDTADGFALTLVEAM
ncbi:MAG TPA: L-histidine N(alpha)-methyltransferase [Vicinamibacterales bacterium]|jgi:dimethylhistidine N-methyltransferase